MATLYQTMMALNGKTNLVFALKKEVEKKEREHYAPLDRRQGRLWTTRYIGRTPLICGIKLENCREDIRRQRRTLYTTLILPLMLLWTESYPEGG